MAQNQKKLEKFEILGLLQQTQLPEQWVGGLSDLVYVEAESTVDFSIFYTLTDRGPNGKEFDLKEFGDSVFGRPFLNPQFSPTILKLKLDHGARKVSIIEQIILKDQKGRALTGLPNVQFDPTLKYFDEVPFDAQGQRLQFDKSGIDPEALYVDHKGQFWIGEEYGPSIVLFDQKGVLIQRWIPEDQNSKHRFGVSVLPKELSLKVMNRGFEAVASIDQDRLAFFLQSAPENLLQKDMALVLIFNRRTHKPESLVKYPLDKDCGKIGAAAVDGEKNVLIFEQNGKKGINLAKKSSKSTST